MKNLNDRILELSHGQTVRLQERADGRVRLDTFTPDVNTALWLSGDDVEALRAFLDPGSTSGVEKVPGTNLPFGVAA